MSAFALTCGTCSELSINGSNLAPPRESTPLIQSRMLDGDVYTLEKSRSELNVKEPCRSDTQNAAGFNCCSSAFSLSPTLPFGSLLLPSSTVSKRFQLAACCLITVHFSGLQCGRFRSERCVCTSAVDESFISGFTGMSLIYMVVYVPGVLPAARVMEEKGLKVRFLL